MAVGKPILMAVEGDAADLVRNSNSGILAESDNPVSIAKAAQTLLTLRKEELIQMADNGKNFYDRNLSLQSGTKKFCEVFYKAIKNDWFNQTSLILSRLIFYDKVITISNLGHVDF